jgi:hypothetical protein
MNHSISDISASPFHFNKGEARNWNAEPETLEFIRTFTEPGMATAETGAGASTVVFAAGGCRHVAISPHVREHEAILSYCHDHGIDTRAVTMLAGRSENVLPTLSDPLDLAFVDGAHSFPHPVIDAFYLARLLRPGGVLILDDVPIPAVGVVFRHLRHDPAWRLRALCGARAVALERVRDDRSGDPWSEQWFNRGYPDRSFLPPRRRLQVRRGVITAALVRRSNRIVGSTALARLRPRHRETS